MAAAGSHHRQHHPGHRVAHAGLQPSNLVFHECHLAVIVFSSIMGQSPQALGDQVASLPGGKDEFEMTDIQSVQILLIGLGNVGRRYLELLVRKERTLQDRLG